MQTSSELILVTLKFVILWGLSGDPLLCLVKIEFFYHFHTECFPSNGNSPRSTLHDCPIKYFHLSYINVNKYTV